jgi:hypothetical protein
MIDIEKREKIMKNLPYLLLLLASNFCLAKQESSAEIELAVLQDLLTESRITQLEFNQQKARLDYQLFVNETQNLKPVAVDKSMKGVGTGSISGTVQVSNVDEENVEVTLCQNNFYNCIDSVLTDQFGAYTFSALPAGTYYVRALNSADDYINAMWASTGTEICINCQPDADNEIVLADTEVRAGIDLDLVVGGSISGQVTESATPLDAIQVYLRKVSDNSSAGYGLTDVTGNYSIKGLPADDYYLIIQNAEDVYIDAMWSSLGTVQCYDCNPDANSTVTLAAAEVRAAVDFTLTVGATLSGDIYDESTLGEVTTFTVQFYDTAETGDYWYFNTQFDGFGGYTVSGIPAGDYKIYLNPTDDNLHIPEVYNDIQCNACSTLVFNGSGATVSLVNGATTSGIDFALEVGASISGFIVDNNNIQLPLTQFGLIYLFNDSNRLLANKIIYGTDFDPMANGAYKVGGLLPGIYFVQGGDAGRQFYQRELYENIACPWSGCDRGGGGDPVSLGVQEQRLGVNFLLNYGGKISGTVTDQSSGLPINPNGVEYVQFYNAAGEVAGGAGINPDGTYTSQRALPPGTYSVRTGSMFNGALISPYVMEKYDDSGNIDCPGVTCDLTAGNVTVVAYDPLSGDPENDATVTGIDFALSPAYSFSGTITELSPPNNPIPDVHVLVYDEDGDFANWATTDASGNFTVHGLPAGRYYALTNNGSNLPFMGLNQTEAGGWIDILYNSMPCPGSTCDVTMGTPIDLGPAPVPTEGLQGVTYDFALNAGGTITGQVRDFSSQLPASGVEVNVYNSNGEFYGSYVSDNNGYYLTVGFPAGTYYLTTSNNGALIDAKYGGGYCEGQSCDPLDATPIEIIGSNSVAGADFELKPDFIFRSGLE